jgi:hypothetical protein
MYKRKVVKYKVDGHKQLFFNYCFHLLQEKYYKYNLYSSAMFAVPETLGSGCVMATLSACTETDKAAVESGWNRGLTLAEK